MTHSRTILSWQPLLQEAAGGEDATQFCDWLTDGHWPLDLSPWEEQLRLRSMPSALRLLIEETGLSSAAQIPQALASSEALGAHPPDAGLQRALWFERAFLRGSILLQRGNDAEAEQIWERLLALLGEDGHDRIIIQKIRIEQGTTALNRGNCRECLRVLAGLAEAPAVLGTMALSRGLAAMAIAALRLGDRTLADAALERCKLITCRPDGPEHPGIVRLRIKFALARENYDQALQLIGTVTQNVLPWSKSFLLLQHERVRLHLVRNEVTQARDLLKTLEEAQVAYALSSGIMDLTEEQVELELRARNASTALVQRCDEAIARALQRRDERALVRLQTLKANALSQLGQVDAARARIGEAMGRAELLGLRTDLVDMSFHAAGLAFQDNDAARLRQALDHGETLCRELGLKNRRIIFSYLRALAIRRQGHNLAIFELLQCGAVRSEIAYFLEHYGMLTAKVFRVSRDDGACITLAENELRRRVWHERGIYFFPHEGVLAVNDGQRVRTLLRAPDSFFARACAALLHEKQGLCVEDFHKLGSRVRFHPIRHHGAARVAIHRVRQALEEVSLTLEHDRRSGRYRIADTWARCEVRVVERPANPRVPAETRCTEILRALREAGQMTTTEICQVTGVSRQVLHPVLKRLEADGLVRLVVRGPKSRYEICER